MEDFKPDFEFNLDEFSGFNIDIEHEFESRIIKPPKSNEIAEHLLKYDDAEKLAKEIIIDSKSRYFVVINGSFIFGDFIEALIVVNNFHVKQMIISTLSMSENNVDSLANLVNGNFVDELNLIVSDYFYSHERYNLIEYLYQELDKDDKFQLAVAGTHCKICIFETHCDKKILIHGSANLRSSSNIEQFVIEENELLYDFNFDYQQSIVEKFKTINKPVRGAKLWQAVQADRGAAMAGQGKVKKQQRLKDHRAD
ncbi:hypothetical protein GCM10023149_48660 [Mucilaginibacter gynuensis]|uniref:Phospholipase D-like protein n=1 Tax=Mucilaginibacter gynuensis TaxID=1302236 RepID=A0ABP8HFR0_9SPHI